MGSASERRLRAMMRKADARKKSALLANHYVGTVYSGAPLLTESDVDNLRRSFKSDDERYECATMLRAACILSFYVDEVQIKYLEVINALTFLSCLFGRATEYLRIENLLNELCLKRDGDNDERLQKRVVSTGRLATHSFNIILKEASGDSKSISLEMSDNELALISKVIEIFEQTASELKAMTRVIRDVMRQYSVPIHALEDSIDHYEKNVRERICLTKSILYDTDFEDWDKVREILLRRADVRLKMMEAVADYDDIVFNEDLYEQKMCSLEEGIDYKLQSL